jgi:hypothetical protein
MLFGAQKIQRKKNICYRFKQKMENGSPGNLLNPFTICSSWKLKFVICPFVYEETNGKYPFANGLHRLAHVNDSMSSTKSPHVPTIPSPTKTWKNLMHLVIHEYNNLPFLL